AVLTRALDFYEQFARWGGDDSGVRAEVARAHYRVGMIHRALGRPDAGPALQRAAALYEALLAADPDRPEFRLEQARCWQHLGWIAWGTPKQLEHHERWIGTLERLVAARPG